MTENNFSDIEVIKAPLAVFLICSLSFGFVFYDLGQHNFFGGEYKSNNNK